MGSPVITMLQSKQTSIFNVYWWQKGGKKVKERRSPIPAGHLFTPKSVKGIDCSRDLLSIVYL